MTNDIIKHTDPFWGEIELREVGRIDTYFRDVTYYIIESEKFKYRGLETGAYSKDINGVITHLMGEEIELISKIYDKLTRID